MVHNESNIDNNTSKVFVDDDEVAEIVAGNDVGSVQIITGNDDEKYDMTIGNYESVKSKLIGVQRTDESNVDDNTFTRSNENMKINARCKIDGRSHSYIQSIRNDGQQHERNNNSILYQAANNDDDEWSENNTFSNDDDDYSVQSIDLILPGNDQEEFPTQHTEIGMYPCMLNSDDLDGLTKLIIDTAPVEEGDQIEGIDVSIVTKRDLTALFLHAIELNQLYYTELKNNEFEIIFNDDDSVPTHLQVQPQQNTYYYRYYLHDPTYDTLLISPWWNYPLLTSQYYVLCTGICGYLSMFSSLLLISSKVVISPREISTDTDRFLPVLVPVQLITSHYHVPRTNICGYLSI